MCLLFGPSNNVRNACVQCLCANVNPLEALMPVLEQTAAKFAVQLHKWPNKEPLFIYESVIQIQRPFYSA